MPDLVEASVHDRLSLLAFFGPPAQVIQTLNHAGISNCTYRSEPSLAPSENRTCVAQPSSVVCLQGSAQDMSQVLYQLGYGCRLHGGVPTVDVPANVSATEVPAYVSAQPDGGLDADAMNQPNCGGSAVGQCAAGAEDVVGKRAVGWCRGVDESTPRIFSTIQASKPVKITGEQPSAVYVFKKTWWWLGLSRTLARSCSGPSRN